MLREKIFEIIPKPSNKDVISYNEDLIDLLDIDVIFEYKNDFSIYEVKKNNYEIINFPRECYIDGMWNKDNVEEWLTEIQIPIKINPKQALKTL